VAAAPKPVDNEEALSCDTQFMHDRLENYVSEESRKQGHWKFDIVPDLPRIIDAYSLDGMFQHVKEIAVAKQLEGGHVEPKIINKRTSGQVVITVPKIGSQSSASSTRTPRRSLLPKSGESNITGRPLGNI